VARFKKVVDSIGSATITEIAQSGPRAQVYTIVFVQFTFNLLSFFIDKDVSFTWNSVGFNYRRA